MSDDQKAERRLPLRCCGLDDEALRGVIAAAEGNPLLAAESARALVSGSTAPPANLRAAVRAALGSLPPAGRWLAGLLAVAGRPLSRTELDALVGLSWDAGSRNEGTVNAGQSEGDDGVDRLEAAETAGLETGLLVRRDNALGYRHALLLEAAYADLADPTSRHERVADALDSSNHAEIAHHLTVAGRPQQAAHEWAAAAEYARSVGALTEAAEFLVRATACAPDDGQLWLELEEVWAWLG